MADEKVVKIAPYLSLVGAGHRFEADEVLEGAKGEEFTTLAILAEKADGSLYIAGNANAGEVMILMKKAERLIVFGEHDNDG